MSAELRIVRSRGTTYLCHEEAPFSTVSEPTDFLVELLDVSEDIHNQGPVSHSEQEIVCRVS